MKEIFIGRSEKGMNVRVAEELHADSANQLARLVGQGVLIQMLDHPVGISRSPIETDHKVVEISDLFAKNFPG